ncbi:MAG: hypothetical protein AAF127_03670 [Pseudomonadota bacterium]
MTIHFAAAQTPSRPGAFAPIAQPHVARVIERAANDNWAKDASAPISDILLRAALQHFAQHGLGAAQSAHASAQSARARGDMEEYGHWLGILRALDRRLAAELEKAR